MATPLIDYLNNHLAGSVAAIEVLEHGIQRDDGSSFEVLYSDLLPDIVEDQETLKKLIASLDARESSTRKVAAWIGEKISRVTRTGDANDVTLVNLGRFQEVEALALGILGKKHLWIALAILARTNPRLQDLNYELLTQRADQQHRKVEDFRQTIVHASLTSE